MSHDTRFPGPGSASSAGRGPGDGPDERDLAPVIPLFGTRKAGALRDAGASVSDAPASQREPATWWAGAAAGDAPDETEDAVRERAEAVLLRRLRGRSLSLAEARDVLRGVEGLDESAVDTLLAKFADLGYLDDTAFAEQLALSAVERRGQGRQAVVQTLRKRGIPRDVADAVVAELPDDDAERALEFAQSKARSVGGKDYDASLRRLAGQLARRGYSSSVALTAARQALDDAGVRRAPFSRPAPSGVRFTPDE